MNTEEFEGEVERLRETFGGKNYPNSRTILIFRMVSQLPVAWFAVAVDRLILKFRQPPMIEEIMGEVGRERDRQYQRTKNQSAVERGDERDPFAFSLEDSRMIVKTVVSRIRGGVSDVEWEEFNADIGRAAEAISEAAVANGFKPRCKYCANSGGVIVHRIDDGSPVGFRCSCASGAERGPNWGVLDIGLIGSRYTLSWPPKVARASVPPELPEEPPPVSEDPQAWVDRVDDNRQLLDSSPSGA